MKEHICVVGLGYIGLPTSIMFVKQGFQLTGVDVNPNVIAKLSRGELHIHEDGLADAFNGALASGISSQNHGGNRIACLRGVWIEMRRGF